jgi:hypothetical protein
VHSENREMVSKQKRERRLQRDPNRIILTMIRASAAGVCASRCVVGVSLTVGSGSVRHGESFKKVKVFCSVKFCKL